MEHFLMIPEHIEKDKSLSWNEKAILSKLISLKGCEYSDTLLAEWLGMEPRTFKNVKARLKAKKIITCVTDGFRGTTKYLVNETTSEKFTID